MYKNLSVGKKLSVSFGIILFLYAATIALSLLGVRSVAQGLRDFYDVPYQVTQITTELELKLNSGAKEMMTACADTNPQRTLESLQKVDADAKSIQEGLSSLEQVFDGEKALITSFRSKISEASEVRKQIVSYAEKNEVGTAVEMYAAQYSPKLEEAVAILDQIDQQAKAQADQFLQRGERIEMGTLIVFMAMGLIGFGVSILLGVRLRRGIAGPISEIKTAAHKMSQGNLKEAQVTYQSRDELGQLAEAMRSTITTLDAYISDISRGMEELSKGNLNIAPKVEFKGDFTNLRDSILNTMDSFNTTLSEINQSSEQVASGSNQVSSGAQELSQGAAEQSSALQELADTIDKISAQVKDNAENAVEGSAKVTSLSKEIVTSNEHMQDMMGAIQKISGTSSEIGKIIKTIEDIAFQTNILALNAAVEAARAGEAGKGFAVVADEVRNLASKSAEAAKSTTSLIESSIEAVQNGTEIAEKTAQSLQSVVQGAKDVTETISRISQASEQQANSIIQVTQGIDQISSVVQTNSATSEESAAASEELSGQAQILKSLVARFKLKPEYQTAPGLEMQFSQPAEYAGYHDSKY